MDGAVGGDIVLVQTGTYGGFETGNRRFTESAPLIIKAAPGAVPVIRSSDWYVTPIGNSSHVVLDGLTLDGGGQPVYCTDVDHLILANLEARNSGQEAVHIRGTSRFVDILACHIHHTGSAQPRWAEGIHIGNGSQPFMNSEHIRIESNEVFNVAFGRFANGIQVGTMGPRVVGNTIRGRTPTGRKPGINPAFRTGKSGKSRRAPKGARNSMT